MPNLLVLLMLFLMSHAWLQHVLGLVVTHYVTHCLLLT